METNKYDLAGKEFSKQGKIILWSIAAFSFLIGVGILFISLGLKQVTVSPSLSVIPLGISVLVAVTAAYNSVKRKEMYFIINEEKMDYQFGVLKSVLHVFKWNDLNELVIPSKQKKVMLVFKDGHKFTINLTWVEKHKSLHIIRHIYQAAKEKNLKIQKVKFLSDIKG